MTQRNGTAPRLAPRPDAGHRPGRRRRVWRHRRRRRRHRGDEPLGQGRHRRLLDRGPHLRGHRRGVQEGAVRGRGHRRHLRHRRRLHQVLRRRDRHPGRLPRHHDEEKQASWASSTRSSASASTGWPWSPRPRTVPGHPELRADGRDLRGRRGHDLEPGRPQVPQREDRHLRPGHRVRHLRLLQRGGPRRPRRGRGSPATTTPPPPTTTPSSRASRARPTPGATSATPTTRTTRKA